MAINLNETLTLVRASDRVPAPPSFLRDLMFPTDPLGDVFRSVKVLVDIRNSDGNTYAPYVVRHSGGSTSARTGFYSRDLIPPMLKETRSLTLDDIEARGFGESLFSGLSAEERSIALIQRDIQELKGRLVRSIELQCAQVLLNNGISFTLQGDEGATESYSVSYFEGVTNPAAHEITNSWDGPSATILSDIDEMCLDLAARGLNADSMIVGGAVAKALLGDSDIRDLMKSIRMDFGSIKPELLPNGASRLGVLRTPMGYQLDLYCYTARYSIGGASNPFIPDGAVVVTQKGAGRCLFGAVNQVEQDRHVTRDGMFVPKYIANETSDVRSVRLTSCPLCAPRYASPWVSATAVFVAPDPEEPDPGTP